MLNTAKEIADSSSSETGADAPWTDAMRRGASALNLVLTAPVSEGIKTEEHAQEILQRIAQEEPAEK